MKQTNLEMQTGFYDNLPENSNWRFADNPRFVDLFLGKEKLLALSEWPYLMLLKDKVQNTYTWHILCNDYNIPRWIENGLKSEIEYHISAERGRPLEGVELICRKGFTHQFL